jgi:hypothetical protein
MRSSTRIACGDDGYDPGATGFALAHSSPDPEWSGTHPRTTQGPYAWILAAASLSGAGRSTVLSTATCLPVAPESSTACITSSTW